MRGSPMPQIAFILAATEAGPMIVNRLDVHTTERGFFGVGAELLQAGHYAEQDIQGLAGVLSLRRQHCGDGVVALDVGANIGTHTVAWAKLMTGWGEVLAVEPQERVYYALAGNIAINNLFNARALQAVIGEHDGWIEIPVLDHTKPASFGSLELRPCSEEVIGQTPERSERARMVRIDTILDTGRVDLIKLDVEGMELAALEGAEMTIEHWRPVLFVEWAKCGAEPLRTWLAARGYDSHVLGINLLAIHQQDPVAAHVQKSPPGAGQGG